MRRSVFWSLCAALLLSVAALWWPEPGQDAAVVGAAARAEPAVPGGGGSQVPGTAVARAALDKASFDPFVGAQPPQPAPSAPPPEPKPFVGPIYVPPPSAPAVNYRYLGQMVDPAGARLVYLAGAAKDVSVSVGTRLDEGYVVEAITTEGVRLHYPPLDVRVVIPMPTAAVQ